MTKYLRIVAPLLATAALAAGCGGGSDTTTSQPAAQKPAAQTDAPSAAKQGAEKTVELTGSTFQPGAIDLKVGETVTFVNQDEIAHTATSDAFDSGTLEAGAKFSFTATKAGQIAYVCNFHPGMTGTINVT
ncbi:MAG TPA: plastocyanin/azurin family copper-binding protein [Solirubrobacter sp.]|nr:plastocyanin/azurin family copper-binding protein [Solirubrobacter sp.]